jgi:hypothetical protein
MKNCVAVIAAISKLVEREPCEKSRERLERLHAAAVRINEHLSQDLAESGQEAGPCELATRLSVASLFRPT